MDVINSILREFGIEIEKIVNVFKANSSRPPSQKYFFPISDYNPLHGMQRKVDNPQVNLNTSWPTATKYLDQLNGNREKHIILHPAYQIEFLNRKYDAMHIVPRYTQLDPYYQPVIPSQKGRLHGTKLDSREGYTGKTPDTFYNTVLSLKQPIKKY